jgi:rhomboid protease GluP
MNLFQRFRFFILPFALIVISGIALLGTVRTIIEVRNNVELLSEEGWEIWAPLSFVVITWFLFLRRKINILKLDGKHFEGLWPSHMLIILALVVPIGMSSALIENLFSQQIEISSINEIDPHKKFQWYCIDELSIETEVIAGHQFAEVSGKHADKLHYETYFLSPLSSTLDNGTLIWIGKSYTMSMSNHESDEYKNNAWETHWNESQNTFRRDIVYETGCLKPVPAGEDRNRFLKGIHRISFYKNKKHLIFERTQEQVTRNLASMRTTFLIGSSISLFAVSLLFLFVRIQPRKLNDYIRNPSIIAKNEKEVVDIILLRTPLKALPIITAINLIMFFAMMWKTSSFTHFDSSDLFEMGGLTNAFAKDCEYWRIICSMFLHSGFLHVLNNMVMFVIFALFMEHILGTIKFTMLYIICGISAGVISVFTNDSVNIGAGGAIFGLVGWALAQRLIYKKYDFSQGLFLIGLIFGVISLTMGFIMPNVNNFAHLIGLLTGAIFSVILTPEEDSEIL